MILSNEIRSSSQEREKGGSVGSLHFPEHMPIGLWDALLLFIHFCDKLSTELCPVFELDWIAPFLMPSCYVDLIPENLLPNIEQENEQKVV